MYDVLIRGGMIYDGSGADPMFGDLAVNGDKIAFIGSAAVNAEGRIKIDASGLAVAPGFINMLSWSAVSLIEDGRGQSDIRQGVTLEVFGEGWSMGPLNDSMKREMVEKQSDIKYSVEWTTLGEYLDYLAERSISPNIASFVGATTIRVHVLGYEDRTPTTEEFDLMQSLVRQAMEEGALGVGSALIYPPAFYAKTDELIVLCKAAAEYEGMYITHLRSEGNRLLDSLDEMIMIAHEAEIPVEVYHLKAVGKENWGKINEVISKIEKARSHGLRITADMYTYTAGETGLDAAMPPWVQEGGHKARVARLKDPEVRKRVIQEMKTETDDWENLYLAVESADNILLVDFKNEELKSLTGKTLSEVATMRGQSASETAIDLVIEDDSRVGAIYFLISEDNVQKQIRLPWVSFGSDAEASAPEGVFLKSCVHPRTYGNFARLLGKYVREKKLISLQEAIRRLTSLPARNLGIKRRGALKPGYFADVVIFDPKSIRDHATYDNPFQYSTGVTDVFVNGEHVLRHGEHTGAMPGRVIRGPGWTGM